MQMDNEGERNAYEKQQKLISSNKATVSGLLKSNTKKNKILDCMT
jgi:hypothetical protein